jgi:hypothetical protein
MSCHNVTVCVKQTNNASDSVKQTNIFSVKQTNNVSIGVKKQTMPVSTKQPMSVLVSNKQTMSLSVPNKQTKSLSVSKNNQFHCHCQTNKPHQYQC